MKAEGLDTLFAAFEAAVKATDDQPKAFPARKIQLAEINKFIAGGEQDFEEGQEVERNEYGKSRYVFPREGQVAVVSNVIDGYMPSQEGGLANMEIIVFFPDGDVRPFMVDSRCYRLRQEKN